MRKAGDPARSTVKAVVAVGNTPFHNAGPHFTMEIEVEKGGITNKKRREAKIDSICNSVRDYLTKYLAKAQDARIIEVIVDIRKEEKK